MITYPLDIGCTAARHAKLGVHATINARAGLQHLNDQSLDEIEMHRDARAIKAYITRRVRFYQVCSRFFRRHQARIQHLIASYDD